MQTETPHTLTMAEADPMPDAIALKIGDVVSLVKMDHIRACVGALTGLKPSALPDVVKILEELVEHIECCDERQLLKCDIDPHPPSVFSVLAENARYALGSLKGTK